MYNCKVYVISKNGKPLMPTKASRARKMLKNGKAKVVQRTPFTIQLTVITKEYLNPITLGVDAGSKTIGISATTDDEELYSSEIILRNDIVELLSTRREMRRIRRNRKTRHRKARWLNRKKYIGWLAPSIKHKVNSHIKIIEQIHKILPITKIIIELASFDIQKINNPEIEGKEYQQGNQLNFWNIREYVLHRDNYTCKGKKLCKNKILNVHHIESRKTGGNSPNNLITLCEDCHKSYHNGTLKLNLKRGKSFKDATFMGIMRWVVYNKLKELYSNVEMTYGYITKNTRINLKLPKEHRMDAYCITQNFNAKLTSNCYIQKFVRKNNRQLHKMTVNKGGYRKNNQCLRYVNGYQLFDKVLYDGKEVFITTRRKTGSFKVSSINNSFIKDGVSYKKLKFLEKRKTILIERAM